MDFIFSIKESISASISESFCSDSFSSSWGSRSFWGKTGFSWGFTALFGTTGALFVGAVLLLEGFVPFLDESSTLFEGFGDELSPLGDGLVSWFDPFWDELAPFFEEFGDDFSSLCDGLVPCFDPFWSDWDSDSGDFGSSWGSVPFCAAFFERDKWHIERRFFLSSAFLNFIKKKASTSSAAE